MYPVFGLVLSVTRACNMRCHYCYTGKKSPQTLSDVAARRAVDRAVASLAPGGTLELGFFGGEPLLEPDLVRAVLDYARGKKIGFSKFVSFGNKAGLTELDLMYYMSQDPATKVILMYLEEMQFGKELIALAQYITSEAPNPKPILAIKSGRTSRGAAAAASHTGSLAGADTVSLVGDIEGDAVSVPGLQQRVGIPGGSQ